MNGLGLRGEPEDRFSLLVARPETAFQAGLFVGGKRSSPLRRGPRPFRTRQADEKRNSVPRPSLFTYISFWT